MDSPFFATPVARQGPTSRLLKRRSDKPPMDVTRFEPTTDNFSFMVPYNKTQRQSMMNETTMGFDVTRFAGKHMNTFIDEDTTFNKTMRIGDVFPPLQSSENLFIDFLATISVESDGPEALDQVAELEELVSAHVQSLKSYSNSKDVVGEVCRNLSNERNTWRMIGKLYHDRLCNPDDKMDTDSDMIPTVSLQTSEKRMIERIFSKERTLRQAQAVVEWLEANVRDDVDSAVHLEYFSEATSAWENTQAVLEQKSRSIGRAMVKSLDPDAPHRERLPLHDQDAQDEHLLMKTLFGLIRSGQLDKAQQLCIKVGQPWRAATLEGWKLYHDPNYERDMGDEKLPVEGNRNRDIWKLGAWRMTQDDVLPQFERAIYSVFCGNVKQLLSVCKTWEDCLWAYTKGMIDCLVESEIREMSSKIFVQLPTEYWENKRDLKTIFDLIGSSSEANVRLQLDSPYHIVQRCLIIQEFETLFEKMDEWIGKDEYRNDPHLLRYLSHVVLVLRKIEPRTSKDKGVEVIRTYSAYLMQSNRVQQVAWYVSQLPHEDQILMYAEFLESINVESDRRLVITLAVENDLPISQIKSRVVKNIFSLDLPDESDDQDQGLLDCRKIDSLGWLLYDEFQRSEAMYQANALIRCFIEADKFDRAKETWTKLPENSSQIVAHLSAEMNGGEVHPKDLNTINEYLCWQVYFRGKDSFADWFDHFHRDKPKEPLLMQNPTFTEKVAHEQRVKQFQRDHERWQAAQTLQANEACANLNETLTFSGGWLVDQVPQEEDDENTQRLRETDFLRKLCIPQVVLLLHSVLHKTGRYDQAIALSDTVASERYGLYEVYHQENMRELLTKIRETSLKAMETGKLDALGLEIEDKSS